MTELSRFLTRDGRWIAGGFLLCFFSSFGQTFFIALSNAEIRAAFDLSHGDFGVLYMVATLGSAATLPFLGGLLDRHSIVKVAIGVMVMLALACLALPLAGSIVFLVLSLYLLRLFGQGMMTEIAHTAIGKWFVASRGRAISISTLGQHVGTAIFPFLFVAASAVFGWRGAWMAGAAVMLALALPLIGGLVRRERDPLTAEPLSPNKAPVRDWSRREVLLDPKFYAALIGVLAPPFIGTTIFFHQVYLTELKGWPLEVFALGFTVMSLATVASTLVAGSLVDRYTSVRLLPSFLVPLGIACFIAAWGTGVWAIFVFMALLGLSMGLSSTLVGSLWPELYGAAHLGAIRSIVISSAVLATAVGPGITGYLIDHDVPYESQLAAMGVYSLIAAVVMLGLSRRIVSQQVAHAH
ncbi:Major facilitator superfamily (MFS) transporter [Fulvimarina pelagi HTCC2506]|uniref:Major facilitator superfamily (MFS) transporter n=1 Tax=Fulvimarina pelagi HTCC2506 TaxID=314231 RepID=Q0G5T3_9HYPH|nr:MFS transporter [Fulvimarina pelagi]EAU42981.1 Major facilitator superfamily (MFS) transporter [Fulvimarina pelagi HTCC2506]